MPPDSIITPPMLADVVRILPAVATNPPALKYPPVAVMLPSAIVTLRAVRYAVTLALEYVPSLPNKMLTPFAYVKLLAATVVVVRLPENRLPVTAAPPVTCRAPVPDPVLGVPETICRSCKLCGLVGLALETVALV